MVSGLNVDIKLPITRPGQRTHDASNQIDLVLEREQVSGQVALQQAPDGEEQQVPWVKPVKRKTREKSIAGQAVTEHIA